MEAFILLIAFVLLTVLFKFLFTAAFGGVRFVEDGKIKYECLNCGFDLEKSDKYCPFCMEDTPWE